MEFAPRDRERSMYRTLTGTVVPRPIGWIATTSPEGVDDLAPYSFFDVVSVAPPVLVFAPGVRSDGLTDTARNGHETEFDHAGLERAAPSVVRPPRVAGVAVAYECELHDMQRVGSHHVVTGEVVRAHVDDDLLTAEGKVDVERPDAVGRLAGDRYDAVESRFRMPRPD